MPDIQHKHNGICCGVETRVYGIVLFVQPEVKVNGDYYREVLLNLKGEAVAMHQGNIG